MITIGTTILDGAAASDLLLSYHDSDTGESLIRAVEERLGHRCDQLLVVRTRQTIDLDTPLSGVDLVHGDVIHAGDLPLPPASYSVFSLDGVEVSPVPARGLRIGRGTQGNELVVIDDTVSKRHAVIGYDGSQPILDDLGSTNGTKVDGERVHGRRRLRDGSIIELGEQTTLRLVRRAGGTPSAQWQTTGEHLRRSGGHLHINRTWREMPPRPTGSVTIEAAPATVRSRRFPIPTIAIPVLLGAVIVLMTGRVMFIAFALLGPTMGLWNWWESRRSGGKEFAEASARYKAVVAEAAQQAGRLRSAARSWATLTYPSTPDVADRAIALDTTLWDRHRSHPDFMEVRVGTGITPVVGRVDVTERGDEQLVATALALRDEHQLDRDMPVTLRLDASAVVTIVGPHDAPTGLASALAIQLAVRNSPNDVRLAFIGDSWSWANWLPHTALAGQPPLVGHDADGTARVVEAVELLLTGSAVEATAGSRIVLFVQPPVALPAVRLNALLAAAGSSGLSIVWVADKTGAPAETRAVVRVDDDGATVQVDSGPAITVTQLEQSDSYVSECVARSLAPLIDPGTSADAAIPERVALLDVIGAESAQPDAVLRRWRCPYEEHLLAQIGMSKDGVVTLDLSNDGDGPNGLVGGTVGAGKSEFLQSLVLALAANYPPSELNFLFVDFKGGATFHSLLDLPHQVGMIRNLDGALAVRAQRSLQAEFRRRQMLLPAHGVQKMSELREKDPANAEPALMVIIDEYAELAEKLPEFLDAVVELAQTGRALGLHLLLATQAPGQTVSRRVQNCVKYRISFRLKDSNESAEVLGRGRDASKLPNRPGRGLFLDGNNVLHEFQAAWAGAQSLSQDLAASARTIYGKAKRVITDEPTDLERVLDAVCKAAEAGGFPAPRRPWHEPLPDLYAFDQLAPAAPAPGVVGLALGLLDLPASQQQLPFVWDLSSSPNMLVFGDARAGKTTALRTIAMSAVALAPPGLVEVIGIDAVGGALTAIDVLPHVRGVIASHDADRLRRLLAYLEREANSRRAVIGRSGSLEVHRRDTGDLTPDLVVLVDGLSQLLNALEALDGGVHFTTFTHLVTEGAAVGIHYVLTSDQPQRVPMAIRNTARERLVLRLANRDAANAADVNRALDGLPDGRALTTAHSGGEVQIAVVSTDDGFDGTCQARAIEARAERFRTNGAPAAQPLPQPPDVLTESYLTSRDIPIADVTTRAVALGVDDLLSTAVSVEFSSAPTLAIAGPDLSGRTNAVAWIAHALRSVDGSISTVYFSGRGDPVRNDGRWTHPCRDLTTFVETLEGFAAATEQLPDSGRSPDGLLIAIDDCDEIIANPMGLTPAETELRKRLAAAMDAFHRAGRGAGVAALLAGRLNAFTSAAPWAQRFKQNTQALILSPALQTTSAVDTTFGVSLPRRSGFRPTPGSAVLVRRGGSPTLIRLVLAE